MNILYHLLKIIQVRYIVQVLCGAMVHGRDKIIICFTKKLHLIQNLDFIEIFTNYYKTDS